MKIPSDRFDPETHLDKAPFGCFLDQPGLFDPRFFRMTPREALETDPGQRLALVTAYEALEESGFVPNRTPSSDLQRIGTFFGQVADEYKEQNMSQNVGTYFIPGSMRAFAPGRINHFFKFGGPAYSVDTACSSSLVALQLACSSIKSGECDMAVAGGMNICCSSDNYKGLAKGHFLSETGGCKTFDELADGYSRGEAVACVVVKRLDAAIADNDPIFGTILSIGTNYNVGPSSITRPDKESQKALFTRLLREAKLAATNIDYIEAHGTGTQQGDITEMSSLAEVFAPDTLPHRGTAERFLGAIKPNVGHSESASGLTSLIKALLVITQETVPKHIGIKRQLNPQIPQPDKRGFTIPLQNASLYDRINLRALVNNFSAAGGNTAMILQVSDYSHIRHKADPRKTHIITVSGKSRSALQNNVHNLLQHIEDVPLADLAYTTTARRVHYSERVAVVADSLMSLTAKLSWKVAKNSSGKPKSKKMLCFAFTGQGSASLSTAKELFASSLRFREDIVYMNELCIRMGLPGFSMAVDGTGSETLNLSPSQTQLALIAIEIALARLCIAWGLQPQMLIGHSLGEYAALCIAKVLTISDTLYLVGNRARLIEEKLEKGSYTMMAVRMAPDHLSSMLELYSNLEIATINGPSDVVVSGPAESLRALTGRLKIDGVGCKMLEVSYGYHSRQMLPIADEFRRICQNVRFCKPQISVLSPLLRKLVDSTTSFEPDYLVQHLSETVDFASAIDCVRNTVADGSIWVECGPSPLCSSMIPKTDQKASCHPMLRPLESSWATISKMLAAVYSDGHDINWHRYHEDFEDCLNVVPLPSYAFDNENFWIPYENNWLLNKGERTELSSSSLAHGSFPYVSPSLQHLTSRKSDARILHLAFESRLDHPDLWPIVAGHKLDSHNVCPAVSGKEAPVLEIPVLIFQLVFECGNCVRH